MAIIHSIVYGHYSTSYFMFCLFMNVTFSYNVEKLTSHKIIITQQGHVQFTISVRMEQMYKCKY